MSAFILGSIEVTEAAVVTNKDTYLLSNITAVSVRRPFIGVGLLFGGGLSAFTLSFVDLLHIHEVVTITLCAAACVFAGLKTARLQLLSRDLKNTQLADAIWGEVSALQAKRVEIASKMNTQKQMEIM